MQRPKYVNIEVFCHRIFWVMNTYELHKVFLTCFRAIEEYFGCINDDQ